MTRPDYLAQMGEPTRKVTIAVLVAAASVCYGCFVIIVAVALVHLPNAANGPIGPILGSIAIFGVLAFATSWMAFRLLRRERSANGITTMPERFIQIFGILLLLGIGFTAILNRNIWLVVEGVGVAIAMITIRSMIRGRQSDSVPLPEVTEQEAR